MGARARQLKVLKQMQIVKCQTKVKTVIGDIKAIVIGVCIRDESVMYEIGYFQNGNYVTAWIRRYEFEIDTAIKKKAGLVNFEEEQTDDKLLQIANEKHETQ